MDIVEYLKVLRRRWRLVAVMVVLAVGVAILLTPAQHSTASGRRPGVTYRATATMLQSPSASQSVNVPLTRFYMTVGEIPKRAAAILHYTGDPVVLASTVTVGGDDKIGTITVQASGSDGKAAAARANAFAQATIDYLQASALKQQQQKVAALQTELTTLQHRIAQVETRIAGSAPSIYSAQRDALLQQYQATFSQQQQIASSVPTDSLTILQQATPVPVAPGSTTLSAPTGRVSRIAIAAVLALVLGAAAALVVERFDTRLRTRGAVEDAFRLPVIAEIPALPRRARHGYDITTRRSPESATAEGYRAVRAALYLMPSLPVSRPGSPDITALLPASGPGGGDATGPQVILVTSPTPQSGKTRTAANLAACIAETGRSVLVLDCDLRHPNVGRYFDIDSGWGLTDLLANDKLGELATFARKTDVQGVAIVTAGSSPVHPAVLLTRMADTLRIARQLADVVVIDAPPIIGTSDALDLMPHVDSVVVLAWAGRTRREQSARSSELLGRVGVPVLGVALITPGTVAGYPSTRSWRLARHPSRRRTTVGGPNQQGES